MSQSIFGIQRFFSIATALTVLTAMIVVGIFFRTSAMQDLVDFTGENNVTFASSLSATLLPAFPALLEDPAEIALDHPARVDAVMRLNAAFSQMAKGAGLLKIKVYRPDGLTVYCSDNGEIGTNRIDGTHPEVFLAAVGEKEPQSGLSFEDHLSAFSGEVFNRDVVETYYPILGGGDEVLGVLEIYTDITMVRTAIDRRTILAVLVLGLVFLVLYLILVFVVMRRVMAPVLSASSRAAAIRPQESGLRLPTGKMPVELLPLITAVNEALDRLDKSLTGHRQFTADAAHELLTPLSVLKANVETITKSSMRSSVLRDVDAITEIVSQLLELAELDSLDPGQALDVDLRAVCADVVSAMAPIAVKQSKSIELAGSQDLILVRCCPKLLGRALRSLVENAVAHTPERTTVRVRVEENGTVRVLDEGPGISIGERELIFQRFWRGKDRKGPGAGLGLSIVRQFAEAFGGSIDVGESEGGGAEFILRLPLSHAP